jgi:hypothetical protein
MTKLEQIEAAIAKLDPADIAKLREWLEEYDARLFDQKLERDAKAGKLDDIANAARNNLKSGRGEDL